MNRTANRRLNRYVVQKETETELLLFIVETRESLFEYVEHILLQGFCLDAPLARLRKGTDEAMLTRTTQTNLGQSHGGEDGGVRRLYRAFLPIKRYGLSWRLVARTPFLLVLRRYDG